MFQGEVRRVHTAGVDTASNRGRDDVSISLDEPGHLGRLETHALVQTHAAQGTSQRGAHCGISSRGPNQGSLRRNLVFTLLLIAYRRKEEISRLLLIIVRQSANHPQRLSNLPMLVDIG